MRRALASILALVLLAAVGVAGYRYYWLHRFDGMIARVAPAYELEPSLVHAVIYQESFFRPHAASGAGARGLMQVTDVVFEEWRRERGIDKVPSDVRRKISPSAPAEAVLADPETNIHIGCWYLSKMIDRFDREGRDPMPIALAAYNAGATHAERWLRAAKPAGSKTEQTRAFVSAIDFPETKAYVEGITERYRRDRS